MRRIVVETEKANKFITDVEKLVADNDLEIEINMDELEVYIGFAPLLEAKMVELEVPEAPDKEPEPVPQGTPEVSDVPSKKKAGRPKGGTKTNEVVIEDFKRALDSLNHGTHVQNLTAAIEITGLSKSFLNRLYYSPDETAMIDDRCNDLLKKLMNPDKKFTDESTRKNAIMIRRVANAKKTDDPYFIADTIMSSTNMQKQTDFKDVGDVIKFIKQYGIR